MALPHIFGTTPSPLNGGLLDDNFNSLDSLKAPINAPSFTGTMANAAFTASSGVSVAGNSTLSGTVRIVGAATFDADPAGRLLGSTYTPTAVGFASSIGLSEYTRIGNVVFGAGYYAASNPTVIGSTFLSVTMTLPIALVGNGAGCGVAALSGGFVPAKVTVSGTTITIGFWTSVAPAGQKVYYSFYYTV